MMDLPPTSKPSNPTTISGISRSRLRPFHLLLFISWILIAGYFLASGWSYYSLPLQDRPFNESYDTYKPGGSVGLDLGILGTLCMVIGVLTYSVRKRVHRFNRAGKLRDWLSFHIFLCTLGPFLVLLHTSFKVNGLVAISFVSMVVVVISGITGRYLYVHVPRTLNGQRRNLKALHQERIQLLDKMLNDAGISQEALNTLFPPDNIPEIKGVGPAIKASLLYQFDKRRGKKWILEQARNHNIPQDIEKTFVRMMRTQFRIESQIAMLTPFQKLFSRWIAIHVPLTIIMGIIVLLHIGVAFAFGYILEF